MDDQRRSNDELLEQILQEAQAMRASRNDVREPSPLPPAEKEPEQAPPPRRDPQRGWKRFLPHRWKHKRAESNEEAEDIYYGLPLKPLEEYQRQLEDSETPETPVPTPDPQAFSEESEAELDEEISSRFQELHDERRRKVEQAMRGDIPVPSRPQQNGVVRPLPKQAGIDHGTEIFSVTPGIPVHTVTEEFPRVLPFSSAPTLEPETPAPEQKDAPSDSQAEPSPEPPRKSSPVLDEFSVDAILEQVRNKNLRSAPVKPEPDFEPAKPAVPEKQTEQPEETETPPAPAPVPTTGARHADPDKPTLWETAAPVLQKAQNLWQNIKTGAEETLRRNEAKTEEAEYEVLPTPPYTFVKSTDEPEKPSPSSEEKAPVSEEPEAAPDTTVIPEEEAETVAEKEPEGPQPLPVWENQEEVSETPLPEESAAEEPELLPIPTETRPPEKKQSDTKSEKPAPKSGEHKKSSPAPRKDTGKKTAAPAKPDSRKASASSKTPPKTSGAKSPQPDSGKSVRNPFVDESPRQAKMPRESREGPSYAPHTKPVHLMDLDVLDFALREESRFYEEKFRKEEEAEAARRKKKYLKMKKQQAVRRGFALHGDEPENDPSDELETPPEELEDLNAPSDVPSVSHDLRNHMRELMLRTMVTGLCTGLLGVFGFLGEFNTLFGWDFPREITAVSYPVLNLIFLLVTMGFCFRMIGNGLKALFQFHANSDSGLALAAAAALIQAVYACFFPEEILSGNLHLYTVLAAGALFLNSLGKFLMVRRIWHNFRFAASREPKYAVQLYEDYNTSLKLARDCVAGSPVIAYQQKAGFLTRFLQNSYEPDPLESACQTLAPIGMIASLALCIISLIVTRDFSQAVSAFTASACICVPFTGLLGGNLLLHRLALLGKKCGAMVVGYPAIEKFSSVNAVMIDARELYPKGTIILNGIKTFGLHRIDEAIMEATALMEAAGGPLVSVFEQIVQTRREILPKVDKPVYEDGRGITGWVGGHRVLIGNRDLLAAHQINPLTHEKEKKYTAGGKKAVYLAVGGQLVALFILTYHSDPHRARELQRLETNGISLILRTCDPNITNTSVANSFGLDPHSIRVLPDMLGQEYLRVSEKPCEKTPALLATRGRAVSMLRILSACVRTRSNLTLASVMQSAAVILGFVLIAFMVCYSGMKQLSTLALILYELFWCFAVLFLPRLHKP